MNRELISPRILADQLACVARAASAHAPERYEEEICRRLDHRTLGLADWERDEVLREMRIRRPAERAKHN